MKDEIPEECPKCGKRAIAIFERNDKQTSSVKAVEGDIHIVDGREISPIVYGTLHYVHNQTTKPNDLPGIEVATGDELTRLGELLGVVRMNGESDESYRKRLCDAALAVTDTDEKP